MNFADLDALGRGDKTVFSGEASAGTFVFCPGGAIERSKTYGVVFFKIIISHMYIFAVHNDELNKKAASPCKEKLP
jgi:hypothetical protein